MKSNRKALLAKVHIAKKELGLSDEIYRAVLEEKYGVRSAKELKIFELIDLCRHFEKLGWKSKPPKGKPRACKEREALLKKVFVLCYNLGVPVPEYATGIAKKMFGVDYIGWCNPNQLHKIVAALMYQLKRKRRARLCYTRK